MKRINLSMQLPGEVYLALSAVADAEQIATAELARRVLVDWVGQCSAIADAADTAGQLQAARLEASRRLGLIQRWYAARRAPVGRMNDRTDAFLAELPRAERVSRATLYNWEKRWIKGGIDALMDGRSKPRQSVLSPFMQEFRRLCRKAGKRLKLAECYRAACQRAKGKGWKVPSYEAARLAVKKTSKGA